MKIRKSTVRDAVALVTLITAIFFMTWQADATQVKYCKNPRTGEIIVIEANYPCPSGTHKV